MSNLTKNVFSKLKSLSALRQLHVGGNRDLGGRKIRNAKTGNKGHDKTFEKVRDKRITVDERISSVLASYLQLQQLVKVSNSLIRLSSPPTAQIQTAGRGQGPGPMRWSALGEKKVSKAQWLESFTLAHEHKPMQPFTLAETLRDVSILIICVHSMPLSP